MILTLNEQTLVTLTVFSSMQLEPFYAREFDSFNSLEVVAFRYCIQPWVTVHTA